MVLPARAPGAPLRDPATLDDGETVAAWRRLCRLPVDAPLSGNRPDGESRLNRSRERLNEITVWIDASNVYDLR
jgi:hypothetical protein